MGVITSYLQKYNSLENQIALFDAAKDQFLAEVNAERNFYNNLIKIREKYLIQDALLLNEFKHKAQKVKRKITGQSTLYCHIVKIPNLYYPKTQKNFLNKVLLIHGKKGELEYRCHPSLRKSMKLKTEIIFSVNKFNRQKQTFTWFLNGNNQDISHTNTQFIPSIIQKLKLLSLYRWLEKENIGLNYYRNKNFEYHVYNVTRINDKTLSNTLVKKEELCEETSKVSRDEKLFKEFNTKFTKDQYEYIKNLKLSCEESFEDRKDMKLRVDLSSDIFIECNFTIESYDFDDSKPAEYKEESKEKEEGENSVLKQVVFYQILESWIWRNNIDDIISLDLMAFLSQKYTNHIISKLMNPDIGLHWELLYSEPSYFKYHINHFCKNKDLDTKLVKRTTIVILEIENFKMIINVKSKTTNDSEYLGTFETKEVNIFVDEIAVALEKALW